jgi:hypothetical protein
MKVAFPIALVLCYITTVCAKMPWGLSGRRFVGTVKTGSAEDSLHAADLTNCTVGNDGTTVLRGGDDIPPSNSTVGDDGTTVLRGRYGIHPSNTPPSKKYAQHKGGSPMSSLGENGLTNFGCCVGDSLASAAERMANSIDSAAERMANARVEASMNIRKGIRNGMVVVGVCMVISSSGVCMVVSSLLERS